MANLIEPEERAAIERAIKATEYKYFGDYEMSDDQREAVEQLVLTAQRYLALTEASRWREIAEAIQRARDLAMKQTLAARIPECGDFGAIAQDLDWALSSIQEGQNNDE
jgi:hypothetical protein